MPQDVRRRYLLPDHGRRAGRREAEEGRDFVTGWRLRESLSTARRGVNPDGYYCSEDHPVAGARHSLQQAGAAPEERPAIGRASCRERVRPYVSILVVAGS